MVISSQKQIGLVVNTLNNANASMATPIAGSSLHLIGTDGLALNPTAGEVFLLNGQAAFIWTCIEDHFSKDQVIEKYSNAFDIDRDVATKNIDLIIAEWRNVGLITTDQTIAPKHAPQTPPSDEQPPIMLKNAATAKIYQLLDTIFEVRFEREKDCLRVDPVLQHLGLTEMPGHPDVTIDVVRSGNRAAIGVDGVQFESPVKIKGLAPQVKAALLVSAINRHEYAAYLHAAVLRTGESLLLMPGAPGAGKTSLSLALTRHGYVFHSDENALLDENSLHVRGAPMAACVKEGSWAVVEPMYPGLSDMRTHVRIDDKIVRYISDQIRMGVPEMDQAFTVRWMIFPKFQAGAKTTLEPVGRPEALRRLLSECIAWRMKLTGENVDRMIDWIENIECYELVFSSFEDALPLIDRVCGKTRSK